MIAVGRIHAATCIIPTGSTCICGPPFRINYSNVHSMFRFCALESDLCTWAVGEFMATERPQNLPETFAKSTVMSESLKNMENFN